MSFAVITDDCVACGTCVYVCAEEAIVEDDGVYYVNPKICSSFDACSGVDGERLCQLVCAVDADAIVFID